MKKIILALALSLGTLIAGTGCSQNAIATYRSTIDDLERQISEKDLYISNLESEIETYKYEIELLKNPSKSMLEQIRDSFGKGFYKKVLNLAVEFGEKYSGAPEEKEVQEFARKAQAELDKLAEIKHGTSEYVDYIWRTAKEDAVKATDEELQSALDWLKANTGSYFLSHENMELAMYYGELLEHKYKNTGNQYETIGWQAYKTVKYVYRGVESVGDEVTQDNLYELKFMLSRAPDIV